MNYRSLRASRAVGNSTFAVASRRCEETGGALVEYAFVILTFLSLVFGIGAFSHAVYAYHFVNNEAKEATRWAAVNGHTCGTLGDGSCNGTAPMNNGPASSTDVNTYVINHAPPGIDSSKIAPITPASALACGLSDTSFCTDSLPDACITGNVNFVAVNNPGCTVKVTVAYPLTYIFPLLPKKTTTTAPCTQPGFCISSTSEMIIAH
jgi:Flp pilus assembly protein TadG